MFFNPVENTVGKRQIACCKDFHLSPLCFQKTFNADRYKPGLVWEKVNSLPHNPDF